MQKGTLSRAALGNVASLGDLYDARTDNFCGISIFKKRIPEEALTMKDSHFSDIHLTHSDTFTEKFSKLDVRAELQVSVLAGLFTLEGSGRYLKDQKMSARTVKSSLLYNIKTKEEKVNVYHEQLKDAFVLDAIESGIATHLVVGISWGANSVLSCEYQNVDNRDIKEIEGSLSAHMENASLSISGKASVEFNEGANDKNIHFDIRVYGDILPRNQDLPTTFEGALNLMKQMPGLVADCNEGRGKPLVYQLIPITLLKDYLNFAMKADCIIKTLEEECLLRVVHVFEQMSEVQQEINDFHHGVLDHKFCVRPEDLAKIISLKEEFAIQETKFRSNLAVALSAVRSGKAEVSILEGLIASYKSSKFSPEKLAVQFTTWGFITEKIAFSKSLVAKGAKYIGFGTSLDDEILKDLESKAFVLYFKDDAKRNSPDVWKINRQLFLQEMQKGGGCKYFAVDCDIHPEMWPKKGISIQVVKNGKVLTESLRDDQAKTESIPFAKCIVNMEPLVTKPNKRVKLVIACTGQNCKPNADYEWICEKCGENIEYGFDSKFYCGCGMGPVSMYEFKCTDGNHGVAYERHNENYLDQLLGKLRPFKEMNILILGETGVGKSTWINGFINFLTFESLQEAEENDLCTLIPSEFTVCDEDFNEITVSTGTDLNEFQTAGQSATQESKVYPFVVGDTKVRLIDTPGIGDTRGVDQDKKNFQNILSTLSYLDELHGICILLKPNNSRLTVMFRFCIKELLTYLHRDASHNIMFCFTNSRGTFYRPGETMPALRNLLKENKDVEIPISSHTVYCYDSEAYRFLAAIKDKGHPVKFPDDERDNFAKSWEKSTSETKRMLKHISGLKPHPIQNTLNLNHARELVVQLTRPLAEISKAIQTNKLIIEDHIREIKETENNIKELKKKRTCPKQVLEIVNIAFPKTVCTNPKCTRIYGSGTLMRTDYFTVCHDKCGLSGIPHDTVGDAGLLGCDAMVGNFCRHSNCGHHYREHMHVYYDTREVTVQVEDESITQLLKDKVSAAEVKQRMIENKEQEIKENDDELQQIEQASVKFACFLKRNAITPYNDAMLEYMDHLIREERNKVNAGGSAKTLESLQLSRYSYESQTQILDKKMEQGTVTATDVLNPSEVDKLVKHLFQLKHNGKSIQRAINAFKESHNKVATYQEVVSKFKPKKLRSTFPLNIGPFKYFFS